jgi:lysine-ketoglutarate reductase/saccharopine dehydrogenase-like protein (TIGR00300 family)
MAFPLPQYKPPDFEQAFFRSSPNVSTQVVLQKGVAPAAFHATTIFPEYFKIDGDWVLAKESRMDCAVVLRENGLEVMEQRRLVSGEKVVVGRGENGEEGIYVHTTGFAEDALLPDKFAFRLGRSRETSYSQDYDTLYDLLEHEKEKGYIVWVLGPAVAFDSDARDSMVALIKSGFVHALFAGNGLAAHDLEAALFKTALGQDIYTQRPVLHGHYHHLDVINMARSAGSIEALLEQQSIDSGVVHACLQMSVPMVLAGSIRDDGPLPGVLVDVCEAQDAMREHTRKATTLLGLATQLHTIAAGNMTPSYQIVDERLRPVYLYSVDISEFAVNKLRDRGTLGVTSIVTNIQDFLVILKRNLIG